MKRKTLRNFKIPMNLQLFAEGGDGAGDGDDGEPEGKEKQEA